MSFTFLAEIVIGADHALEQKVTRIVVIGEVGCSTL